MGKITKFQAIVLVILAVAALIGAGLFAAGGSSNSGGEVAGTGGKVELWGTLDAFAVKTVLSVLAQEIEGFNVSYTEFSEAGFEQQLIESIASGVGPDAIIMPHTLIARQIDKVRLVPYESFSERNFRNTFTEGSEIFLTTEGTIGLPLGVDPLVMYWNRNRFTNQSVLEPPKDWESFFNFAANITERDREGRLVAPAVAFGEYQNVRHAKDVLSMLIMQAGNPLFTVRNDAYVSTFKDEFGTKPSPAQSALIFYTDFADPLKAIYSWNRSLPNDRDVFSRGDLAVYFGTAGELSVLRALNPNLNFDVAGVPQPRTGELKQTIGTFYTVVPLKTAKNSGGAFTAMVTLSGERSVGLLSSYGLLQPVRRTLLAQKPNDPFSSVFYDSAFIARGWLDPAPLQSNEIYKRLIEDVVTGRSAVSTAIMNAHNSLNALYK